MFLLFVVVLVDVLLIFEVFPLHQDDFLLFVSPGLVPLEVRVEVLIFGHPQDLSLGVRLVCGFGGWENDEV